MVYSINKTNLIEEALTAQDTRKIFQNNGNDHRQTFLFAFGSILQKFCGDLFFVPNQGYYQENQGLVFEW